MTFGMNLAEHLTIAASASMFYIETDYKNEPSMKVAATILICLSNSFFNSVMNTINEKRNVFCFPFFMKMKNE